MTTPRNSSIIIIVFWLCAFLTSCLSDVNITKVHLIFMNHLDVGYNGIPKRGFVVNVMNRYFQNYFPAAVKLAQQMTTLGYEERFIYTTHPWLVSFYLDCPENLVLSGIQLQCPTPLEKENFMYAAKRGDITWHAGPMNMQFEAMDVSMVEFGLQLSEDMDARLDIKRQHRTLSQRDVPGMTQAMIPILERHGIEGVSVGVNTATSPPAVPKIFNWVFNNSSVIAMWNPGGYPRNPGPTPNQPGGLSRDHCVTFPDLDEAMCFSFRGDNSGPPTSVAEVLASYEISRVQFPGATIVASTFENFLSAAIQVKDKLPVVTKEIGDTWIFGIQSDPSKVARMRTFFLRRSDCLFNGTCSLTDLPLYNASRFLLKTAEHTWGLNNINDAVNWTNDKFYQQLQNKAPNYQEMISSWTEQQEFIDIALDILGDSSLAGDIKFDFEHLNAQQPNLSKFVKLTDRTFSCKNSYQFEFGEDGSLTHLQLDSGEIWATPSNPLGQIVYKTYNDTDFTYFHDNYVYSRLFWLEIGKRNLTSNCPTCESKIWKTKLLDLYRAKDDSCNVLAHITMDDERAMSFYGAPPTFYINYLDMKRDSLSVQLQWFDKKPTRLAESISLSFRPPPKSEHKWTVSKLGQWLDPLNIVQNGSQRIHAIDRGVNYAVSDGNGMKIVSDYAPLVTFQQSDDDISVLPLPLKPLSYISGVAINLFNNAWDCNYIFWHPYKESDAGKKFTFRLYF